MWTNYRWLWLAASIAFALAAFTIAADIILDNFWGLIVNR